MSNTNTSSSTVGSAIGLPLLLVVSVFMASIGACGKSCQGCTQKGIRSTVAAVKGEP